MEEIDDKICLEYKTAMSVYNLQAKSFWISLKDIEIGECTLAMIAISMLSANCKVSKHLILFYRLTIAYSIINGHFKNFG